MPNDILRTRGWLSEQSVPFQDAVLASGHPVKVARGQTVFSVGDPPGGAYAILAGELAIEIAPGADGPHIVHVGTPGGWFGEISFLSGQPRRITFRALDACELFHLPRNAMERISASDPEAMRRFAGITVQNLDLAFRVLAVLVEPDPARRIAAMLLLCLGEPPRRFLTVSHAELGRMCNVSRNTVGRVLAEFAGRGWVRQGYARIEVLEPRGIERRLFDFQR